MQSIVYRVGNHIQDYTHPGRHSSRPSIVIPTEGRNLLTVDGPFVSRVLHTIG